MSASHRPALTSLLLLLFVAGCSQQTAVQAPDPLGSSAHEAEIASALAEQPSLVDDDVAEAADETSLDFATEAGAGFGAGGAIRPLTFWRTIRDIDRRFEFAFADTDSTGQPTRAVVTIHKHFTGSFNLLVADDAPANDPPSAHVIRKPLRDHWVRRVLLRRVRVSADGSRTAWRIAATSGVEVTSRGAETRIKSLRIQSGVLDTTITDPLAFFRLRGILKLEAGAEVKLTVATGSADDVVVFYLRHRRARFHNNGDGTHSAAFRAPDLLGVRHLGVNALSHGTLFDEQAPYDSQAWIEPYLVHPIELVAFTPDE